MNASIAHILYISLTILFAGFVAHAVIQFAYTYIAQRWKKALPPLFLTGAAFLYCISDVLASIFAFITPEAGLSRFFVMQRELSLLLFVVITPYYMNRIFAIRERIKNVNRVLFWIGIIATAAMASIAAYNPDLLVAWPNRDGTTGGHFGIIYDVRNMGPLLIIRNSIMTAYLLYSTGVVLFSGLRRNEPHRYARSLIVCVVLSYFVFSYLYSILFARNPAGYGSIPYPHFGLGIVIFIIFMTSGTISNIIDNYSQLVNVKKNVNKIVLYDMLTDIPNRISFIRDLRSALEETRTHGGAFSLLFLDIDDFQNLNECYGESVGDEILRKFSARLIDLFGRAGYLYRIGGDDFVFLLRDSRREDDAKNLADRIITSLRNPFLVSGVSYPVTASIGILYVPRDGADHEEILKNAYSVIRSAKKIKNTCEVFSLGLLDDSFNRIRTVNILRDNINRDRFTLYYQPVVDSDENIFYAEALLRCTDENQPLGGPGRFIPLIEKAGMAKEVDNMVVRKAFHDMELHVKNRFNISINLSTDQLVNQKYSKFLSSFAAQHGIENRQIILEVTENQLMANLSSARDSLTKLRNSGFAVAIDDFGTGFSSLAYLAELPVDFIKLDMIFVQSIPGDLRKEAMARHIIELAHSLDLKVVAEGFELREQFDFFRELGCDYFQGFLFLRPMPLHTILQVYTDERDAVK